MSEADLHVLSGALAFGGTETLGAGAFRGISRSALEVAGLEREEENNNSSSSNNKKNNNKNNNKKNNNKKNNNKKKNNNNKNKNNNNNNINNNNNKNLQESARQVATGHAAGPPRAPGRI